MIVVTGVVLLFIMFVLYKVAGSTHESSDNTTSSQAEEVAQARLAVFSIVVNHFQVGLLFLSFTMDFPKIALDVLGWLAIPFSFNFAQVRPNLAVIPCGTQRSRQSVPAALHFTSRRAFT